MSSSFNPDNSGAHGDDARSLVTVGASGSTHVRMADHPGADAEIHVIGDSGHIFVSITAPRANVCTLTMTAGQAQEMLRGLQAALDPISTPNRSA